MDIINLFVGFVVAGSLFSAFLMGAWGLMWLANKDLERRFGGK